ncbi:hypothetical protein LCGC14_1820840 [marine sediment metagenome]|uniref:Uncharacterized protein n=1 Tax=marine sediment metagenome TaxID=412755 RepID=A0A0F9GJ59_9ZZZZ
MRIEWNGKKLTKKRALFLCWKLWEWLAENPGEEKKAWPHWVCNGGKVKEMTSECPCCQFTPVEPIGEEEDSCLECPLYEFWDTSGESSISDEPCMYESSQFQGWISNKNEPTYSNSIAAAAKRRYEKL